MCALSVLALATPAAEAGYTGAFDGGTGNAVLTADASGGPITIDQNGGFLRHNLSGFHSNQDFDSVQDGDQMVTNDSRHSVTVVGGNNADTLQLGSTSVPASQVAAPMTFNAGNGIDELTIEDGGDATGRTETVTDSNVSGTLGGGATYSSVAKVSLLGGTGMDTFDASAFTAGKVTLDGAGGNDTLKGGSMSDTLTGGSGADTMQGNSGDDTLNAGDGETDRSIDCGPGANDIANRDLATIDPDTIVTGCETVNTPEPPPIPDTGGVSNIIVQSSISGIKAKASGGTFVTIDTGASGACPPTSDLSCALQSKATTSVPRDALKGLASASKKITLGSLTDSLRPGQGKRVKFKLSKKNSRLFRKLKKLKVNFTISVSTPGGRAAKQAKTVTLKAPK